VSPIVPQDAYDEILDKALRSKYADRYGAVEATELDHMLRAAGVDALVEQNAQLKGALQHIAQYDPRWKWMKVNDAPGRARLVAWAFDAWKASVPGNGEDL
jgi:hypothetical protein